MAYDTVTPRIRGRQLQAIRARFFKSNPLCAHCLAKGRTKVWTELDHTVALTNHGTDTDDNRVGLCRECHAIKTAADLKYKAKPKIGLDGWPEE